MATPERQDPDVLEQEDVPSISPQTNSIALPIRENRAFTRTHEVTTSLPVSLAVSQHLIRDVSGSISIAYDEKEDRAKLDKAIEKFRVGVDKKHCGCPKKGTQNTPCASYSRKDIRPSVTAMLELAKSETSSIVDLLLRMEKVATLLHCRFHSESHHAKNHVEIWKEQCGLFVSVEDQIGAFLRSATFSSGTVCLQSPSDDHEYKKEPVGGQKVLNRNKTIMEIIKPEVYLDDDRLDWLLRVFEANMYCDKHVPQEYERAAEWRTKITEVRPIGSSKSVKHTTAASLLPYKVSGDPAKCWPAAYLIDPLNVAQRGSMSGDTTTCHESIQTILKTPLSESKRKTETKFENETGAIDPVEIRYEVPRGHVYIFKVEGNENFVKIGYTTKTVEKRFEGWQKECNRVPILLYPLSPEDVIPIPFPKRVEELCHAELKDCNIRVDCEACMTTHEEWFETSAEVAIVVVKKWTTWMRNNPYIRDGRRVLRDQTPEWTLRDEEKGGIERMPTYMRKVNRLASSGSSVPAVSSSPR